MKKNKNKKNRKEIAILNKQVWSKRTYCIAKRFRFIKNYLKPTVFVALETTDSCSCFHYFDCFQLLSVTPLPTLSKINEHFLYIHSKQFFSYPGPK